MSTKTSCETCGSSKQCKNCGICARVICKACTHYVDSHHFSFMARVPAKLKLSNYCSECFEAEIEPSIAQYDEMMEKAKDCYFLTKNYTGNVRVLRRYTKRVSVAECDDRRETIIRLAFLAAELGFNAIIEGEVESAKKRMGGYQTSTWKGSALPANIDGAQLERSSLRGL